MRNRWDGSYFEAYNVEKRCGRSKGVWQNARRSRQKYQETMHFSKSAERGSWVDELCNCELLVLDELDKLKPSEGLLEIIYSVLEARFHGYSLTILTTKMSGKDSNENGARTMDLP